ncbi:hypothetical protein Pmar_PMAR009086 [Perkinsus marinus ATCC 50983]|uniref:TFIIS N-terminal domain-containing protein n=1 Tax=Perkinsus marinus (strain ATCC 50983 / TXsc) TaxID=423536 RepID=C5LQ58_PERM5|nr:hypothetical protein Pmar_PMAR009086 [Perkinsus marinus ATCC 50983]EER01166.1 hypothetical protein Pmar_PMAR009086 [Perkinsus marinus ATCC 50983]|eukprot:XP_002768448.1 hypothetical protein Pmar_PMAR009086 [Perkinsus marinus ATCC 50983]
MEEDPYEGLVEEKFNLSQKALQGRWIQYPLRCFVTVVKDKVYFDGGVTYDLVKHSNGKFEVGGYIANPELSSASEIHWSLPTGETATWTYEGENDGFGGTVADVDPTLIITEGGRSKRHKPPVDYAALEAQLRREEAGLTSESSGPTERRSSTDFTMGAHQVAKNAAAAKAYSILRDKIILWLGTTNTRRIDSIVRKRGEIHHHFEIPGMVDEGLSQLKNDYDLECSHKDKMTFVRFTYDQWRKALEKENLQIAEGRSGESPEVPSSPRKRCLCVSYSSPTKGDVGKVAAELNLVPEGTLLETEKIKPLLGVLDRYVMDVETLRDTKIGRIVRRYSRHEDPEVQEASKGLIAKWKAVYRDAKASEH